VTISSASSRRFLKRTVEAKGQAILVENGPDAPVEVLSGNNTSKVRADFDGLLSLAESLQQSSEKHSDKHRRLREAFKVYLIAVCLGFVVAFTMVTSNFEFHDFVSHRQLLSDPILIILIAACSLLLPLVWDHVCSLRIYAEQAKRAWWEDERDLTEVVELLREIEPVLAREENLSTLERVQIRIRLSRFGVGSSARENAGSETLTEDFRSRKSRADQELAKPLR